MSDFLGRLAARSLEVARVVQPAVAPMFAPGSFVERADPAPEAPFEIAAAPANETLRVERPRPVTTAEDITTAGSRTSVETAKAAYSKPVPNPPASAPQKPAPQTTPEQPVHVSRRESRQDATHPDYVSVVPESIRPRSIDTVLVPPASNPLMRTETPVARRITQRMPPPEAPPPAPVIRVSIGRIEVRAEFPAAPPRPGPKSSQPPALSIEEYARQRSEGKR